jgi:hypothetical protein
VHDGCYLYLNVEAQSVAITKYMRLRSIVIGASLIVIMHSILHTKAHDLQIPYCANVHTAHLLVNRNDHLHPIQCRIQDTRIKLHH